MLGTDHIRKAYLDALVAEYGDLIPDINDQPIRRIELQAMANLFFTLAQIAERIQAETTPDRSHQGLRDWASRLGVNINPEDSASVVRNACAGKYKAAQGPTRQNIEQTVRTALGDVVVTLVYATQEEIEDGSYWDGVNPGSPDLDLGGDAQGEWSSPAARVLILLQPVQGQELVELQRIVDTQVFSILDSMLPAYVMFDYSIQSQYEGFILDESQVDITAL